MTVTRKMVLVRLQQAHYDAYQAGNYLPAISEMVERIKLIGHEAFVIPDTVEVDCWNLEGEGPAIQSCNQPIQQDGEFRFMVFNIDVGHMPPARALAHITQIKEEVSPHIPEGVKAFFFARNAEGVGASIQTFRL